MEDVIDLVMLTSRIKNVCEGFDGLNKNIPLDSKNLILLYLYKHETAGNLELTSFLNFAKGNVANLCKKLMNEGLVEYSQSLLDSRNKRFTLTEMGKECTNVLVKQLNANVRSSVENVSNLTEIKYLSAKLLELLR